MGSRFNLPILYCVSTFGNLDRSRFMQRRSLLFLTTLLLLIVGIVPMAVAQAKEGQTVTKLSVPNYMKKIISDQLIADLEAANPTIKVNVLANDSDIGSATSESEEHTSEPQSHV